MSVSHFTLSFVQLKLYIFKSGIHDLITDRL